MTKVLTSDLFTEISHLIDAARSQVVHYVNSSLVMLYWQIGHRINQDILKDERAEYGEQAVKQLPPCRNNHTASNKNYWK